MHKTLRFNFIIALNILLPINRSSLSVNPSWLVLNSIYNGFSLQLIFGLNKITNQYFSFIFTSDIKSLFGSFKFLVLFIELSKFIQKVVSWWIILLLSGNGFGFDSDWRLFDHFCIGKLNQCICTGWSSIKGVIQLTLVELRLCVSLIEFNIKGLVYLLELCVFIHCNKLIWKFL